MTKYNKAMAGGAGAALALIIAWGVKQFAGVEIPAEVEGAFVILLSALGPFFGPANG